jgi:PDZ domain
MELIQTSNIKTITITLISLQFLLLASIFIPAVLGYGLSDNDNNNNKSMNGNVKSLSDNNTMSNVVSFTNQSTMPITKMTYFGSWAPYQIPLESIKNIAEQKNAIDAILKQGYNEYYFPMIDFKSKAARSMTENLLQSANGTKLKIIIILLPPSEVGPKGNFNWNSWIEYLNFLKAKYPSSLDGFVIDDFNLFNDSVHANKVKGNNHHDSHSHNDANDWNENKKKAPKETVTFMLKSKLEEALQKKRKDLHFYPVLYFEGIKTNDVKRHYYNNTDGIVLASTNYYNVTELAHNLKVFSKVFNNKPIRYVIYTDRTSNFIDSSPPSDRLVLSTLSIANESGVVKGAIIWRNTNSPVIRDYLSNRNNTEYVSFVYMMEKLQLKDENSTSNAYGLYNPSSIPSTIQQQEQQQNSGNHHNNDKHKNEKNNSDHNNNIKLSASSSQPSSSIPPTPRLGISTSDLTPSLAEDMGLPKKSKGAVVQSVILGSPAYNAGLKGTILDVDESGYLIKRGDVIISVDGHKVNGAEDIAKQMKKKHLGDSLSLVVNRNGQILNIVAKL